MLPHPRCKRVQSLPWPLYTWHLPQHRGQLPLRLCWGLHPGRPGKELHRCVPTTASLGGERLQGWRLQIGRGVKACVFKCLLSCLPACCVASTGHHALWASETLNIKQGAGKGDLQRPPGKVEIPAVGWCAVVAPSFPCSVQFGSLGFLGRPAYLQIWRPSLHRLSPQTLTSAASPLTSVARVPV